MKTQALQDLKQELHLSYSQLNTYLGCSLRYYFAYVCGCIPERVSVALPYGSGVHLALAVHYRAWMKGFQEPLSVLEDAFVNCFTLELETERVPVVFKKDMPDAEASIALGRSMLRAFYEQDELKDMEILGVELPLSAQLFSPEGVSQDLKLIGVIDLLVKKGGQIIPIDHKTAKNPYSQDTVDDDLQLTTYAYLLASNKFTLPTAEITAGFQVLRKIKAPKLEYYYSTRTAQDRKRLARVACTVLQAIDAGIFLPAKSWLCQDCGYSDRCKTW